MARPGVSKEAIFKAAQELDDEGTPVTVTTVRDKLGKGSYTTITDVLKEWRTAQEQSQAADIPETPEVLVRFTDRIWAEAWKISHKETEGEREALTQARAQLDEERKEMSGEIGRLEQELNTAQSVLTSEQTERKATSKKLSRCKVEMARMEGRTQELEKELKEERGRVRHLEQELIKLAQAASEGKKKNDDT